MLVLENSRVFRPGSVKASVFTKFLDKGECMNKKFIALVLLVFTLGIGVTACGGGGEKPAGGDKGAPASP